MGLLHGIANDCYKMGHFYYACKAFDVLERLDPDPEFWEGKRGAAIGVFQRAVAGKPGGEQDKLQEVVTILQSSHNPQVLRRWIDACLAAPLPSRMPLLSVYRVRST